MSVDERIKLFWEKVIRLGPDDCWRWIGTPDVFGYGWFSYQYRSLNGSPTVRPGKAHRFSVMLSGVTIPPGIEVGHTCDTPPCVNPNHLFLATHDQNMKDMVAKGRGNALRGDENPLSTITGADVLEIRRQYAGGEPMNLIAQQLKIGYMVVYHVVKGNSWKHIL